MFLSNWDLFGDYLIQYFMNNFATLFKSTIFWLSFYYFLKNCNTDAKSLRIILSSKTGTIFVGVQ